MALLDAQAVTVPFESLKRVTRERKYAIEEVEGLLGEVQQAAGGAGGEAGSEAAAARLEQYEKQLQGLKRKVGRGWEVEWLGSHLQGALPAPVSRSARPSPSPLPTLCPLRCRHPCRLQLEATSLCERQELARCRARLQHVHDLGPPARDAQVEWSRRRIDRLLVDHMLRGGYNRAAAGLAASAGIEVRRGALPPRQHASRQPSYCPRPFL